MQHSVRDSHEGSRDPGKHPRGADLAVTREGDTGLPTLETLDSKAGNRDTEEIPRAAETKESSAGRDWLPRSSSKRRVLLKENLRRATARKEQMEKRRRFWKKWERKAGRLPGSGR